MSEAQAAQEAAAQAVTGVLSGPEKAIAQHDDVRESVEFGFKQIDSMGCGPR